MLNAFTQQLKSSAQLSSRLTGDFVERQLKFTAEVAEAGLSNVKKLRKCKSVSEAVDLEIKFVKGLGDHFSQFNQKNMEAIKELRGSASELVKTLAPAKKAHTVTKQAAAPAKVVVKKVAEKTSEKADVKKAVAKIAEKAAAAKPVAKPAVKAVEKPVEKPALKAVETPVVAKKEEAQQA